MPFYKVDESTAIFGKTMKEAYNEAQKQDRFYNTWFRVLSQPLGTIIKIRIHTDHYCMARHRAVIRVGFYGYAMITPIGTCVMFYSIEDAIWYLYTFMADWLTSYTIFSVVER